MTADRIVAALTLLTALALLAWGLYRKWTEVPDDVRRQIHPATRSLDHEAVVAAFEAEGIDSEWRRVSREWSS